MLCFVVLRAAVADVNPANNEYPPQSIDAPDSKKFTVSPSETGSDGTENGANGTVFTVFSAV